MKKILISLIFCLFFVNLFAQDKILNKLSVYYQQGHYRFSYWKADELINNPDFDTSLIPAYYKSLSLFHLQNKFLFKRRNKKPWIEASEIFKQIKNNVNSKRFFLGHKNEVSELRDYLFDELILLKNKKNTPDISLLKKSIDGIFDGISLNPIKSKFSTEKNNKVEVLTSTISSDRENLIDLADDFLGVPYLYGGDSLDGFDCSGFTSFVLSKMNFKTGRTSRDQYRLCKKVERENVKPGDLIFFNSGKEEVTHVGIIVSKQGEPLKMIHSSTSKGVVISEVESSDYWMKKLTGFGTFFD